MSRSQQASRLGAQVEAAMRDLYNLDLPESGRAPWMDAVDSDGRPWEIKGAMHRRANGRPGKFRVFRQMHRQLAEADGCYGFAVYRIRGRGIEILESRAIPARQLRGLEWSASDHGTRNVSGRGEQAKIALEVVQR